MTAALATSLLVTLGAAAALGAEAELSARDRQAIFRMLCPGPLTKDKQGLVCKLGGADEDPRLSELRWSSAQKGRFVASDDEWLVSLAYPCILGCRGETFVVIRAGNRWRTVAEVDSLVTEGCIQVRGFADGRERVVCSGAAGPFQGGMSEWLGVLSFADGQASLDLLMQKDHGGECFLAYPPATAEYDGDELSDLSVGDPASDSAFTVRLRVRRLEGCDSTVEDPESRATVKAEHVLRFLKTGSQIKPDAETAALIERYGWSSPGS